MLSFLIVVGIGALVLLPQFFRGEPRPCPVGRKQPNPELRRAASEIERAANNAWIATSGEVR